MGFRESAGAFFIEAQEVSLDISDISFEILLDDIREFAGLCRIAWNERSWWRKAGHRIRLRSAENR
ncbi:hypothetical protein ATO11_20590 [Pseudaestuariivita atlantica]|uniref:Uncharacterized protein n=1 Tax=Pseudaestuariivita atlantica TaxID=1317121 RepID=A0A0L1JK90_9RHOB|nr:hypothetical protein ATO11_20590 [Pseudaestuariivita atlantica]